MLDVFLIASKCIDKFLQQKIGLQQICFEYNHYQSRAVYALCTKVLPNLPDLKKAVVSLQREECKETAESYLQGDVTQGVAQLNINHACVMLQEIRENGIPNKRRRLSRETREILRFLKASPNEITTTNNLAIQPIKHLTEKPFFRLHKNVQLEHFSKETFIQFTKTLFDDVIRLEERPKHGALANFGEFQALSSCLPVKALEEVVEANNGFLLDLCAAPGSKSLQAAEYFEGVIANELNKSRFRTLQRRADAYQAKSGINNISCTNMDAFQLLEDLRSIYTQKMKYNNNNNNNNSDESSSNELQQALSQLGSRKAAGANKSSLPRISAILLDPSCSGSGMLQTDKQLAMLAQFNDDQENDQQNIQKLAIFQEQLLTKTLLTAQQLKIRYVSYSTCSVHQRENESVVQRAIQSVSGVKLLYSLKDWQLRSTILPECCVGNIENHGCGFFLALFEVQ